MSEQKWISVEDGLPKEKRINGEPIYYLCKHSEWRNIFVGCLLYKSRGTVWAKQVFHEDSNRIFSVSHWMPLPEATKD